MKRNSDRDSVWLAYTDFKIRQRLKFRLVIQADKRQNVGLFIYNWSFDPVDIEANVAVVNASGKRMMRKMRQSRLSASKQENLAFPKYFNALGKANRLRIAVKIKVVKSTSVGVEKAALETVLDAPPKPKTLGDDINEMLKKSGGDIQVVCEGRNIPCLSWILEARSKVFEAMLQHDTLEKKTRIIQISDLRFEVAETFIRYLHSDDAAEKVTDMADELLKAADKYDVEGLKSVCEKSLMDTIESDNVIVILILAEQFNAKYLKRACLAFLRFDADKKTVMNNSAFKKLKTEFPSLAIQVLEDFEEDGVPEVQEDEDDLTQCEEDED